MKFQDAEPLIQQNIIEMLTAFVFPIYYTTEVDNFEYYFIGSGFFVKWDAKCVFVMTKHQYELAAGKNIFVLYGDERKGINISSHPGKAFPDSDLCIFEIPDPSDLITSKNFSILPIEMLLPPKSFDNYQAFCMGYPVKLSEVDYATKNISPKIFGFISDEFSIQLGSRPLQISLTDIEFTGRKDITNLDEATQGLSGSPIIGFKIDENGKTGGLGLLGIATHISTTPKVLYATRTLVLIDCFQKGFGFFDNLKAEDT